MHWINNIKYCDKNDHPGTSKRASYIRLFQLGGWKGGKTFKELPIYTSHLNLPPYLFSTKNYHFNDKGNFEANLLILAIAPSTSSSQKDLQMLPMKLVCDGPGEDVRDYVRERARGGFPTLQFHRKGKVSVSSVKCYDNTPNTRQVIRTYILYTYLHKYQDLKSL